MRWKTNRTKNKVVARIGSGNIFADLGRADAEDAMTKMELAYRIASLIRTAGWTQTQAAKRLGVDQPKISALLRGRLGGFSIERLFHFLNELGQDVEIRIRSKKQKEAGVHVLGAAR